MTAAVTPCTIVTGASRGLGLALTRQLLDRGHRVLALARSPTRVDGAAALTSWQVDLADAEPVAERMAQWLQQQDRASLASVTLVNNAGVVATPAPLALQPGAELRDALRVGLEAPLLLTAAFLRATAGWRVPRKVLMVSSGLGRRAMAGSAAYCAAKAGMDHLARALALEEAARDDGARIVSLAPGVVDTEMQRVLRDADPARFPEQQRFAELHRGGHLTSADDAAAQLIDFLARADFGNHPVADVRDA